MKTSILLGAALAILGMAVAPVSAQTQTTTTTSTGYVQTSKIIGTKVKTAQGEEVGVVKDVVLDRSNGCMAYTVLSAGGTGTRVAGPPQPGCGSLGGFLPPPPPGFFTRCVLPGPVSTPPALRY